MTYCTGACWDGHQCPAPIGCCANISGDKREDSMTAKCKCSYGGPMKMERNSAHCPIHGTDRYTLLEAHWIHGGYYRALDVIRDAIEKGEDVYAAIETTRVRLNEFEKLVRDFDDR